MGDSGGTGGNSQDLKLIFRSLSHVCQTFIHTLLLFICLINDLKEFLRCLRSAKVGSKLLIHQHHGKLAEHIQMYIVLCIRRSDQKQQCNRLSVQGIKINSTRNDHGCKPRLIYCITFAMRNGNSLTDSCSTLFLSCINLLPVSCLIINLTASGHKCHRSIQGLGFVCWSSIQ